MKLLNVQFESSVNIYLGTLTSVHDPFGMHVFQCTAQLNEILPNGPFWDKPPMLSEMFDHERKVTGIRQFQDDVQFVVFDKRRQIFDDVRVVQLLNLWKKNNILIYK